MSTDARMNRGTLLFLEAADHRSQLKNVEFIILDFVKQQGFKLSVDSYKLSFYMFKALKIYIHLKEQKIIFFQIKNRFVSHFLGLKV